MQSWMIHHSYYNIEIHSLHSESFSSHENTIVSLCILKFLTSTNYINFYKLEVVTR